MGVTAACLLALTVVACAADWPTTTMSEDASPPADNLLEDMPATPAAATTPLVGQRDLSSVVGECLRLGSLSCLKPRLLSFLSTAASQDTVWLSDHLAVRRTADYSPDLTSIRQEDGGDVTLDDVLQRADGYLTSHELTLRLPRELLDGSMKPFVPKFLLRDLKPELSVPLVPASALAQERGFIKKIVMPFLLGLKFKATALVPLALGLIALKTWKALTLGLLSLVLSGAMLVFKLTKPKVVNYEVYHYPQPAPVIEHSAPAAYDPHHHGWGRAADLAYRGHVPS